MMKNGKWRRAPKESGIQRVFFIPECRSLAFLSILSRL